DPEETNVAKGTAPSLLVEEAPDLVVKSCRFVNPVPLVLIAKTVPWPQLPPALAVPYSVLPSRIRPALGMPPSVVELKSCRFVNPVPSELRAKTVPWPEPPPPAAVP